MKAVDPSPCAACCGNPTQIVSLVRSYNLTILQAWIIFMVLLKRRIESVWAHLLEPVWGYAGTDRDTTRWEPALRVPQFVDLDTVTANYRTVGRTRRTDGSGLTPCARDVHPPRRVDAGPNPRRRDAGETGRASLAFFATSSMFPRRPAGRLRPPVAGHCLRPHASAYPAPLGRSAWTAAHTHDVEVSMP